MTRKPTRSTWISAQAAAEGGSGSGRTVKCDLLLDAKGFLAGIDLRDAAHVVVMLGPHEAVAKTVSAKVEIDRGSTADQLAHVRITGAKGQVRGHEKNPYI